MNKKISILVKIIILILLLTIATTNKAKAVSWTDIFNSGEDFLETGKNETENPAPVIDAFGNEIIEESPVNDNETKRIVNGIYNILFLMGVVITVAVGGFLGIKFMLASAEDKAKVKESLIPYVIGCVAIYGAFGIWRIVMDVLSSIA